MNKRLSVRITGAVQGVGFRPFVYRTAVDLGLGGSVCNSAEGVRVEIEGAEKELESFLGRLRCFPPPLARIGRIETSEIALRNERAFSIRQSAPHGELQAFIPADVATCTSCLEEMRDPADRRYRYAFTNCTQCGPRYTIVRNLPYDRSSTTMASFVMCPECRREYEDPENRRFHAEPVCCPACGPRLALVDARGEPFECADVLDETLRRLASGEVVAIKGLGGFHLACDAANGEAVARLRLRKHRDRKPLALMVRSVAEAERICCAAPEAVRLLTERERPIVLLPKRPEHGLADEVAPGSASFGVMLPYTPLHHLLLDGPSRALVMTSGNLSDEPIAHANDDARGRLRDLADCFVLHDRDIHVRTDDSVAQITAGRVQILRRSRGYAPLPIPLPCDTSDCEILATGADLSNTVCVTRKGQAFLSHHIGDLHDAAAQESFQQAVTHLERLLDVQPARVACDLHPAYLSSRFAGSLGLSAVAVQHHHAHVASVMAETGRTDAVIGVAFDGLGWGTDGTLWGGEFLICDLSRFERVACLAPVPQAGSDVAAKRTSRMAYIYLLEAVDDDADAFARDLLPALADEEKELVRHMISRKLNCPMTSSAGRLFDAASAILGICDENTYQAQAPMELESAAWLACDEPGYYTVKTEGETPGGVIRTGDLVARLARERLSGVSAAVCAARFHNSIARLIVETCLRIRAEAGLSTVALAGGVFANRFLVERLLPQLSGEGFEVLMNSLVPPGDGGLCLGQAAIAAWRS